MISTNVRIVVSAIVTVLLGQYGDGFKEKVTILILVLILALVNYYGSHEDE